MPKGIYPVTQERREACRLGQLGNTNSLGSTRSISTRLKISAAKMGNEHIGDQSGESNFNHKLTEKDVLFIRGCNFSTKFLAAKFDCSEGNIRCIRRFDSWKNL